MGGESGSGGVLGGLEALEAVEDFDNFLAGIIVGGGGEGDLGSSRFRFRGFAWPLGDEAVGGCGGSKRFSSLSL